MLSKEIRKIFFDYFVENYNHKFIRSSPVIPFCDPTLSFVNAGMNQFKSVFLDNAIPRAKRVTNSQKCIRVGGKHNDLNLVGHDGYHHTFFEMLGNWSFNDYFKQEACEMALNLLKGPYNVDPSRLYVTYFGGDKYLGLKPDIECFEIWRNLGFQSHRILPFGIKENFWEMGEVGPCGPCCEIHIDLETHSHANRSKLVNIGHPDMIELWNIVFIQHKRNEDGSIENLQSRHVDTGMGLERLTSVLQMKRSNYDTDIFEPILKKIQKLTKVNEYSGQFHSANFLDTSYRILADHLRMVVVCFSDGMLPDQNQKLRRILRVIFKLSINVFGVENLAVQLVPTVIATFDFAYPEMLSKEQNIIEIINLEMDIFKELKRRSSDAIKNSPSIFSSFDDLLIEYPGFIPAYKEFCSKKPFLNNIIPGEFLFKLYDTYGLSKQCFQKLAEFEGMTLDEDGYEKEISKARQKSKKSFNLNFTPEDLQISKITKELPCTDNKFVYDYEFDKKTGSYIIPTVSAKIIGIVQSEVVKGPAKSTNLLYIITNRSNFFHASGGQQSDRGCMHKLDGSDIDLSIEEVYSVNDCIVHKGKVNNESSDSKPFEIGDEVELIVDPQRRKNNTLNHSGVHLLNGAIRTLFNKTTYQTSSLVTEENCKLEVCVIGKSLTKKDVKDIEYFVQEIINSAIPVKITKLNMADVLEQNDVMMVPGEIYPESGLRLVTIADKSRNFLSKELCCGTHVGNIAEIAAFCIINFKQTNRARYMFTAVSGNLAEKAFLTGNHISELLRKFEDELKLKKTDENIKSELMRIRNNISESKIILPFTYRIKILERIDIISKTIKTNIRRKLKDEFEREMRNIFEQKPKEKFPFVIHLCSFSNTELASVETATKLYTRPTLVVSMWKNYIHAQCYVPKECVTSEFSAKKWLAKFVSSFESKASSWKSHQENEISNISFKMSIKCGQNELKISLEKAREFAFEKYLSFIKASKAFKIEE